MLPFRLQFSGTTHFKNLRLHRKPAVFNDTLPPYCTTNLDPQATFVTTYWPFLFCWQLQSYFCFAVPFSPGTHQFVVQRDPFDRTMDTLALSLLGGMAAGVAMRTFLWTPLFFCWGGIQAGTLLSATPICWLQGWIHFLLRPRKKIKQ